MTGQTPLLPYDPTRLGLPNRPEATRFVLYWRSRMASHAKGLLGDIMDGRYTHSVATRMLIVHHDTVATEWIDDETGMTFAALGGFDKDAVGIQEAVLIQIFGP